MLTPAVSRRLDMATIERHVSRNVIALDASAPCVEAARLMTDKRIGAIGVREGGRIVGLVTERDLASRVVGRGDPGSIPIREAMRRDVPSVPATATESDCSNLMRDHYTRHLLVEDSGQVVGIISMRDVIRLMLDDKQWLIDQLQRYINGV
jgi:CBS domain-containing protein